MSATWRRPFTVSISRLDTSIGPDRSRADSRCPTTIRLYVFRTYWSRKQIDVPGIYPISGWWGIWSRIMIARRRGGQNENRAAWLKPVIFAAGSHVRDIGRSRSSRLCIRAYVVYVTAMLTCSAGQTRRYSLICSPWTRQSDIADSRRKYRFAT